MRNAPDWIHARYFKPSEVQNPEIMSATLLSMLEDLRRNYGHPIIITGSWRALDGQVHRDSAHQVNEAGVWEGVDLRCSNSLDRYSLKKAAYEVGFVRIGTYDRHLHLDVATGPRFIQNVEWIGVSK